MHRQKPFLMGGLTATLALFILAAVALFLFSDTGHIQIVGAAERSGRAQPPALLTPPEPTTVNLPASVVALPPPPSSATKPAPSSFEAVVVNVPAGDHLQVKLTDGTIREVAVWGIDAPELTGQAYANESQRYLRDRVIGKTVTLQTMDGADQSMLPAKVYVNGEMLNVEMVGAGLAWWVSDWAPQSDALREAQAIAIKTRRGLWADAHPISPWAYRKQHGS